MRLKTTPPLIVGNYLSLSLSLGLSLDLRFPDCFPDIFKVCPFAGKNKKQIDIVRLPGSLAPSTTFAPSQSRTHGKELTVNIRRNADGVGVLR